MPTFTQLTYIISVDKHRHFGRAAQDCFVSQPSLSAQIHKVEEIVGFKIFDRSKKQVTTTDLGRMFVEQSRVVLKEYHLLMTGSASVNDVAGDFKIAFIPTIGPYLIPYMVRQFSEKYPRVSLEVTELKTDAILAALHDDRIDAGILATPLRERGLVEDPLYYEPFHLFVSRPHPLGGKGIVSEAVLNAAGPFWIMEEGHCFRDQTLSICSNAGNPALSNVRLNSGSLETLIRLVDTGVGATLLPALAVESLGGDERKRRVLSFEAPIPCREVSLVYGRRYQKQAVLSALKQVVRDTIPPQFVSLDFNPNYRVMGLSER